MIHRLSQKKKKKNIFLIWIREYEHCSLSYMCNHISLGRTNKTAMCGSVFISKIWRFQGSEPSQNSGVSATETVLLLLAASSALQSQPCGPHCPDIPLPPNTGIFWVAPRFHSQLLSCHPALPACPLPGPPSRYALCSVLLRGSVLYHCPFPGTKPEPGAALQSQKRPTVPPRGGPCFDLLQCPEIKSVRASTLSQRTRRIMNYVARFVQPNS